MYFAHIFPPFHKILVEVNALLLLPRKYLEISAWPRNGPIPHPQLVTTNFLDDKKIVINYYFFIETKITHSSL